MTAPHRHGATPMVIAPTFINGCVSDISSPATQPREHDIAAAMKNYAALYQAFQSYLLPAEQLPAHDYDLAAQPMAEFSHLGCLHADLLDSTVPEDDVSDADIESCGYLAWLHH